MGGMTHQAVRSAAGHPRHIRTDRPEKDGGCRYFEGTRIEEGLQPGKLVVLPFELEFRAGLEAMKDGLQSLDIFSHAGNRRRSTRRIATHNIAANLSSQAEFKATTGQLLQIPGGVRDGHRAAQKRPTHWSRRAGHTDPRRRGPAARSSWQKSALDPLGAE